MNKKQAKEFEKRYDKFENCNLPTPFWDDERKTLEYVYFEDNKPRVNYSIYEALGDIAYTGFYYPFTSGYMTCKINTDEDFRYEVGHNHAHNFEEVVRWLYNYPESFSIAKDEEEFYSKQELEYLRNVKEYLLVIGMKDCKENTKSKSRFKNKRQEEFKNYGIQNCSDNVTKKILDGELDFHAFHTLQPQNYPEHKEYAKKEKRSLLRNEQGKIFALIEFTHEEKKTYKDFKKTFLKIFNKND